MKEIPPILIETMSWWSVADQRLMAAVAAAEKAHAPCYLRRTGFWVKSGRRWIDTIYGIYSVGENPVKTIGDYPTKLLIV